MLQLILGIGNAIQWVMEPKQYTNGPIEGSIKKVHITNKNRQKSLVEQCIIAIVSHFHWLQTDTLAYYGVFILSIGNVLQQSIYRVHLHCVSALAKYSLKLVFLVSKNCFSFTQSHQLTNNFVNMTFSIFFEKIAEF